MKHSPHLLEDLSRFAGSAAGALLEMRKEIEQQIQQQCHDLFAKIRPSQEEELALIRAMAEKAREENEQLKERVSALEALINSKGDSAAKKSK